MKANMNYWDLVKTQSLCTVKETTNKTKRQPKEWEEMFANNISDNGFISKIYKKVSKSTPKRQTTQLRNEQKP